MRISLYCISVSFLLSMCRWVGINKGSSTGCIFSIQFSQIQCNNIHPEYSNRYALTSSQDPNQTAPQKQSDRVPTICKNPTAHSHIQNMDLSKIKDENVYYQTVERY